MVFSKVLWAMFSEVEMFLQSLYKPRKSKNKGRVDRLSLPKLCFCFIESYIKNILPEKLKCKKNETKLNLV